MKKTMAVVLLGLACLFTVSSAGQKQELPAGVADAVPPLKSPAAKLEADFGKMPLYFIANKGQLDERVEYYVQGRDKSLYFSPGGVTFVLASAETSRDVSGDSARESSEARLAAAKRWAVRLDFVGADRAVRPQGRDETGAAVSYFKGKPEEWQTGLPTYSRIVYKNLWPGIDLVYSGTVNKLKYEFVVQPGADPSRIKLAYSGASEVVLGESGRLEVKTPLGYLRDDKPVAFQEKGGEQVDIPMSFVLEEPGRGKIEPDGQHQAPELRTQAFGFEVGDYDRSRTLIMDPVILVYCGYIGGSRNEGGSGIAVDGSGCAYVTGTTSSSQGDFPTKVGPDLTYNIDNDAFVAKVNALGSGLVYCGYIGGSGVDYGRGIAVDGSGNAYVTGNTNSTEATFPKTAGPDLTFNGGEDAFVAKVSASGTGLVFCGYIGGVSNDYGTAIAVDGSGSAYVAGETYSSEATFPVIGGPDLTHNGNNDAFAAKVSASGTGLVYCGYIGGSGGDDGRGLAVDGAGNAYVTGGTDSTEATFPVTAGPDLTFNGYADAFVAKVDAAGLGLVYCGYIGGSGDDVGNGIAVDASGNAYVTGGTNSTEATFPVKAGPDKTFNGGVDAFVAKVEIAGLGLVYCGYIGGAGDDRSGGVAVNASGNAYIIGRTTSKQATFPEKIGPDLAFNGGEDAFVAKANASGAGLVYCGYIGGAGLDQGYGIAVDASGNAYVTGLTNSTEATFPEIKGPDLTYNGHERDVFVAKIMEVITKITVSLPNGGEVWGRNHTYTIKWKYSGTLGTKVKIELIKGSAVNRTISNSAPIGANGSGSYKWKVPSNQVLGTNFRMKITSKQYPSHWDKSDHNFKIVE